MSSSMFWQAFGAGQKAGEKARNPFPPQLLESKAWDAGHGGADPVSAFNEAVRGIVLWNGKSPWK